ncbi:hypothetical protein HHK36_008735 [Tetracentron sinense]|uniref:RNA-binding S4 domain-containing protein n=1 Tax=Tetracentron sinense TaxID=13715 RepID=A0A834ZJK1_TETSI|nr:hypothetical protein HHK36_008735 [Tetracentron sinense]
MLSLTSVYCSSAPSVKALCNSTSLYFFPRNPRYSMVCRNFNSSSSSTGESVSDKSQEPHVVQRSNYAGVRLDETVDIGTGKLRLDSWISSRMVGVSRARVQSSIRSGLVSVNGKIVDKVSHAIRGGDKVNCTISELQPLRAEPEDMPLDIVYEDTHVLVVNKPAHMVVHPAPGNFNGTLVNGILHHCSLPTTVFSDREIPTETDDTSDDELGSFSADQSCSEEISSSIGGASVRPGIVHRLDKGTSGLLVDEHSHTCLSEQFKQRTIHRVYISLTTGVPSLFSGRIEIPIGRDPYNRIRMAALSGSSNSGQARHAASRYRVIEILAGGSSALVEWRLETGRTHQCLKQSEALVWPAKPTSDTTCAIRVVKVGLFHNRKAGTSKIRVHAKYLGIPLLGDEIYGGTKSVALSLFRPRTPSSCHGQLFDLVSKLQRPCLHALALGFKHPITGENVQFSCPPPADFAEILTHLRNISTEKLFILVEAGTLGKEPDLNL